MRWEVVGADRESGQEKTVVVDAGDEAQATRRANRQGIIVSHARPLDPDDSALALSIVPVVANRQAVQPPPMVPDLQKECPFCSELVQAKAKKCKHCGETLDVALRSAEEARRLAENASRGGSAAVSTTVVVQNGGSKQFHHGFHLLLTILTGGLWLPIWIFCYIFRSR